MTTDSSAKPAAPVARPPGRIETPGLMGMQFRVLALLIKGEPVTVYTASAGMLKPRDSHAFHVHTFRSLMQHGLVEQDQAGRFSLTEKGRTAFERVTAIEETGSKHSQAKVVNNRASKKNEDEGRRLIIPRSNPTVRRADGVMGLTRTQARALAWLLQGEPVTAVVQNIAGARRKHPGAMHLHTIRSLLGRGFIVEQPDGSFAITEAGRQAYESLPLTD